jgi:hypothetical protein
MPAHDWTKVSQGIFHDFHNAWLLELKNDLNHNLLPQGYYALTEQVTGEAAPDVIALELLPASDRPTSVRDGGNVGKRGAALLAPPITSIVAHAESPSYARLRKTITIRHTSHHAVVALVEILSRANKTSRVELARFLTKAQSALKQQIHLLVVDLYPPGPLDPQGIHGALWEALAQTAPAVDRDRPLIVAGYEASAEEITAYVEPFRIGDDIPQSPLFLDVGSHIVVPLESSYMKAYASVPEYWRGQVEAQAPEDR